MSALDTLDLLPVHKDGSVLLCSPDVGLFTCALSRGALVTGGQPAGNLLRLGRPVALRVPADFGGKLCLQAQVVSSPPDQVLSPVGYGTTLYELTPLTGESVAEVSEEDISSGAPTLPAPQSGRFYQRPGPDSAPFVAPGDTLEEGTTLGLIEVMKTFAHVVYQPGGALPVRARMVAWIVSDGAEVRQGEPLLEFEPQ